MPRQDAEKIDVGIAAPQPLDQEAISYLLVEKAREGKMVARLKWGDPFVFDRGGEEALFLHEHGMPFEVVPGIPAAIGMPELCRRADHVSRRRRHDDVRPRLRRRRRTRRPTSTGRAWRGSTARSSATPVRSSCRDMLDALLATAGPATNRRRSSTTARCRRSETIDGTLRGTGASSEERARPAAGHPGRRSRRRPCASTCAGSTRVRCSASACSSRDPREQAGEIVDLLESLGAEPIEAPMIRIVPPTTTVRSTRRARDGDDFDWIVFTSAQRRRCRSCGRLLGGRATSESSRASGCARSARHGGASRATGSRSIWCRPSSRAEAIVQALREIGDVKGKRFLLPRADIGREVSPRSCASAAPRSTEVVAYRTVLDELEREGDPDIYRMLLEQADRRRHVHKRVYRQKFRADFRRRAVADLLNATTVASIGPVTAEAAEQYGIKTAIMPKEYTIPALVQAIVDYFRQPT